MDLSAPLAKLLVILIGILFGALVGALIGWLKYKFNINEVVSSIMLNYIAMYLITFYINTFYVNPVSRQSVPISAAARLTLTSVPLGSWKVCIPLAFPLAILAAFLLRYLLDRTTAGYEIKAVGLSRGAARYAGVNIARNLILTMTLTGFLAKHINAAAFGQTSNRFVLGTSVRFSIPGLSKIPVLGAVFTDLYPFEVLIVVIAAVMWYILYHSRYGMHLRACGDNPHAADAAGIDVARVRTGAVAISGALSAVAGMSYAYSISANFSPGIYLGYGYLSIAALIFGNWAILPTLGACLIFGFARSGGAALIQHMGMPSSYNDLVRILPYVLTLLLLMFFSRHNHSPRALGEVYDKGKR